MKAYKKLPQAYLKLHISRLTGMLEEIDLGLSKDTLKDLKKNLKI